ncbi:M56 family metallopeptidase [Roseburia faecis]|jgi:beta-lactamase regulating signal transducer with metallopeptidase domain|uniref:M56 family metallopeptidase n=1 Tax=Roseburia faecis TaxID=301302 RepID=UPI0032BFCBEE
MEKIFTVICERGISAGYVILAVIVLRLLFRKSPRWVMGILWALVAIRLICPIVVESPLSVVPKESLFDVVRQGDTDKETSNLKSEPQINNLADQNQTADKQVEEIKEYAAKQDETKNFWTDNRKTSDKKLLSTIWLLGMLVLTGYGIVGSFRVEYQLRFAVPVEQQIWECDSIHTSFLWGLIHPRIYLPSGMNEETKRYVIRHERAHQKRGDHWWKVIGYVLLVIYWFQPLMWIAYWIFARDIEYACDEHVIGNLSFAERKEYAQALLLCGSGRSHRLAGPLAFGGIGVKPRIKNVLFYQKPGRGKIAISLLVCVVVSVCFLTNPKDVNGMEAEIHPVNMEAGRQLDHVLSDKMHMVFDGKTVHNQRLQVLLTRNGKDLTAHVQSADGTIQKKLQGAIGENTGWFMVKSEDGSLLEGYASKGEYPYISVQGIIDGKKIEANDLFESTGTIFETKEEEADYYVGMGEYGGVEVTKETMDAFMQQIRTAVDDKEAFAKLMDYPVKINYEAGSVTVSNEKEMMETYDTLMNTNRFKENVKEIFVGNYPFYNYMGVMLEIGEQGQNVWIDQDKNGTLGIYAINAG